MSTNDYLLPQCNLNIFFLQNETEDMVVGWSPCIDLESSTVSEVQSFESSIDLASINTDGPSLDAADLTFEFNDQQYRFNEHLKYIFKLLFYFILFIFVDIVRLRHLAQVYPQLLPAAFNPRAPFRSTLRRPRQPRRISVNSFRCDSSAIL